MANEKARDERQDYGVRSSRLQKRRFPCTSDAADRARSWQTNRERELGADLREARRSDGPRETALRKCGSLRRARVLDARLSSGAEHAVVRCIARSRLVCSCDRATRQQPSHSTAVALRRARAASLSRIAKVTSRYLFLCPLLSSARSR